MAKTVNSTNDGHSARDGGAGAADEPSRVTTKPFSVPREVAALSQLTHGSTISPLGSYAKVRRLLHGMLPRISSQFQAKFDASDIVQQSLLDACAKSAHYRGSSEKELVAWLQQILSNNFLDAVRRLRSRKRDIARERHAKNSRGSRTLSGYVIADERTSPISKVAAAEELERIKLAIARLPEKQRIAVSLHHLDGMSLAEVAGQMDCSRGAVAGLVHRGLKALKASLGEDL